MEFLKIYEEFNNSEKIKYFSGSHFTNKRKNRQANERLNDILFDKKNPYYDLFDREELSLDLYNGEGYIAIYDEASEEDFDYVDMLKLNNFIRDYLVDQVDIIIGSYNFTGYEDIDEYLKKVKVQDFNL